MNGIGRQQLVVIRVPLLDLELFYFKSIKSTQFFEKSGTKRYDQVDLIKDFNHPQEQKIKCVRKDT